MSFSKTILSILLCSVLGTMPPAPAAGIHGRGSFSYEGPVSAPDPNIDGCSYSQKPWTWGDEFFRRVETNCVLSKHTLPQSVFIVGDVADDGKIYNVNVESSCQDPQLDADCLQAFATSAGFLPLAPDTVSGKLIRLCYTFKPDMKNKYHSDAVQQYLDGASKADEERIVIRKIPVEVLNRYPGLFSESEILGKENLRPVLFRTHLAVIALSAARWQSFFIAHPKATRQEIEDFKLSLEK